MVHSCPDMGTDVSIFYLIVSGVRNTALTESDETLCIQIFRHLHYIYIHFQKLFLLWKTAY